MQVSRDETGRIALMGPLPAVFPGVLSRPYNKEISASAHGTASL